MEDGDDGVPAPMEQEDFAPTLDDLFVKMDTVSGYNAPYLFRISSDREIAFFDIKDLASRLCVSVSFLKNALERLGIREKYKKHGITHYELPHGIVLSGMASVTVEEARIHQLALEKLSELGERIVEGETNPCFDAEDNFASSLTELLLKMHAACEKDDAFFFCVTSKRHFIVLQVIELARRLKVTVPFLREVMHRICDQGEFISENMAKFYLYGRCSLVHKEDAARWSANRRTMRQVRRKLSNLAIGDRMIEHPKDARCSECNVEMVEGTCYYRLYCQVCGSYLCNGCSAMDSEVCLTCRKVLGNDLADHWQEVF